MLGYNRTIARTNINVLINIGPGVGGGRKRRGKKGHLPNTFDDDCSLIELMHTVPYDRVHDIPQCNISIDITLLYVLKYNIFYCSLQVLND